MAVAVSEPPHQVVISDYTQMDRAIREEKKYIAELLKKIKV